jgi:hypothetical protein
MKDRGMKKWAPYASLIEQKGTLVSMKHARKKIAKPLLSQEQAQEINQALLLCKQGMHIRLQIYNHDVITTIEGTLQRINVDQKEITIDDQIIAFKQLIDIKIKSPIKSTDPLFNE